MYFIDLGLDRYLLRRPSGINL